MNDTGKIKITDPTRILTVANIISLLRALLAVPIVYTLRNPGWGTFTFILIVLAVLSDAADGWLARRAHEVTHFGKWLDPIADFAVILAVVSFLVLIDRFPAWFLIFYLVRYVAIATPAIYLLNHNRFVLSANWWGKWSTGMTALAIFLHIFPVNALPWLPAMVLYVATALLLISWLRYIRTIVIEVKTL
ncbi:MAG: CDP-alcohol phosphatidyltransferase family protein [Fidelibacterota bacterium]